MTTVKQPAGVDTATLADQFTGFAITQNANTVPAHVLERVKHSVLDVLGCALYGRPESAVRPAYELIRRTDRSAEATLIGSTDKVSAGNAALVNSAFIHTTELAEGFTRALVHPSTVMVPAVLAVAERDRRTGMDVLVAAATGYELLIRLGMTVGPPLVLEQGLHPPATLGPFATTAALANLGGLDEATARHALGVVCCSIPSTLMAAAYDHATVKDLFQGFSASAAVLATDLAAAGLTGVRDWLGAWYRSVPRTYDLTPIGTDLGTYWHTGSGGLRIKTRPVMAMAQPTTAALYKLFGERTVDPDRIVDVLVESSKRIELGRIYHPAELVSARASIPFLAAAALCEPKEFVADRYLLNFINERQLTDPRIAALQDKVRLAVDPQFDHNLERARPNAEGPYMKFEARVTITMDDGEKIVAYEDMFALGTGNMTREQTADKFLNVTADALPAEVGRQVVEAVWRLDEAESVDPLIALLARGSAAG
jgi:2-methylcitrate dehydratase PrpD